MVRFRISRGGYEGAELVRFSEDGGGFAIHAGEQPQTFREERSVKNTEYSECPQPQTAVWMRKNTKAATLELNERIRDLRR